MDEETRERARWLMEELSEIIRQNYPETVVVPEPTTLESLQKQMLAHFQRQESSLKTVRRDVRKTRLLVASRLPDLSEVQI